MERLTEKRDGQNVIPLRQDGKTKWSLCSAGMGNAPTQFLYGEYADKLAEYEDLEEQGKLLKPKCLPGDYVWEINRERNIISEYEVSSIRYGINGTFHYMWALRYGIYGDLDGFWDKCIGKTVFLTKPAAEQALKEMEGKKNGE